MADALGQLSAAAAQNRGTVASDKLETASSALGYVLSALPLVLRGEPNVPALLASLRSALETPMDYARGLLIAAQARRNDPSRSLDSLVDTFDSWYQTAGAYHDALQVFNASIAAWPEAARSAPEARQLLAELGESRNTAIREMQDALVGLFSEMAHDLDPDDEDSGPSAASEPVTPAQTLIGADPLWHCETLRAKLEASPFLRAAANIDVGHLAAPFAALEQYFTAILDSDEAPLDAANRVRAAALMVERAAPIYGRALAPALRQFSSSCSRQRTTLINGVFQQVHRDTVEFIFRESTAMRPALNCMYEFRQSLPLLRSDASPEDRAAAREEEAANAALIAAMHEAMQRVEAHRAQMPSPPQDAAEAIADHHVNIQLNLNALAVTLRAVTDLIECCDKARRAIHDGATANVTAKLRSLADAARAVCQRASDMPAAHRSKRLTRGKVGEYAQRTLGFTRRVARTAKCIQYTLGVLADLSHESRHAEGLSREPTLDPAHFQQIADQLADDIERAAKDIDATRNQLIGDVGTRHPSDDDAAMAKQDIDQIRSFTTRLEWRYVADFETAKRQWLRATVRALTAHVEGPTSTIPAGAKRLLKLIEKHLAAGTKVLMVAASQTEDEEKQRLAAAFRENNDIRREVQDCREQLKRLPAGARSASR